MKGTIIGMGDSYDDVLVEIIRYSKPHTYHFSPDEINIKDVAPTNPKTVKPMATKSKTTKSKTKSTFNISFGY
jgi:hypothetical protein